MTKTEIESKIASLNKGINSIATPENMKKKMQEEVDKLKIKLDELDKTPEPPKVEKKSEPKKVAVKKSAPVKKVAPVKKAVDKKEPAKKSSSKKSKLDISCEELLDAYHKRKASHDKSEKKHKTDSISDLIGRKLAGVATNAITNISDSDLKKSPKKYIKQLEGVEKEVKSFISKLKPLLGSDFDKDSLLEPLEKVINRFIKKLKKK